MMMCKKDDMGRGVVERALSRIISEKIIELG
jgi:hypothetical protein